MVIDGDAVHPHFANRDANVWSTYTALMKAADSLGPVRVETKKTSIHLVRRTAFAGGSTRKSWLILTVKSAADIRNPRIIRHEQASAGRWHLELRLESPRQVDREVRDWLKKGFEISG